MWSDSMRSLRWCRAPRSMQQHDPGPMTGREVLQFRAADVRDALGNRVIRRRGSSHSAPPSRETGWLRTWQPADDPVLDVSDHRVSVEITQRVVERAVIQARIGAGAAGDAAHR